MPCHEWHGRASRTAPRADVQRQKDNDRISRSDSLARSNIIARAALSCPRGVRDREVRASHPAGPRLLDIDAQPLIPRLEDAVLLLELT